jgi:hypothetical protein
MEGCFVEGRFVLVPFIRILTAFVAGSLSAASLESGACIMSKVL